MGAVQCAPLPINELGGRCRMKQDRPKVKYTVVDPNAPCEVQKMLKKMIAEKLLAIKSKN